MRVAQPLACGKVCVLAPMQCRLTMCWCGACLQLAGWPEGPRAGQCCSQPQRSLHAQLNAELPAQLMLQPLMVPSLMLLPLTMLPLIQASGST